MKLLLYTTICIVGFYSVQGRTYSPDKKIKKKVKQDIVPPTHNKTPLIGGGNIGLDRWQDNRNLQNGGNWGNGDFINQRQNGGFIDNIQNQDILSQGPGRFQNRDILNQGQGRFQNRDILHQGQGRFQNQDFLNQGQGRFQNQDILNQGQGRFQNRDFLNQRQGTLFNDRFGDRFNGNSRQNQQFGNQWQ